MSTQDIPEIVTIFGGAGYIGSTLAQLLFDEGFKVRVFDNFTFGQTGISHFNSKDVEIIEADIRDTQAVYSSLYKSDAVILLAAISGHRTKEIKHDEIRTVNYLASSLVVRAAIEQGVSRFIFSSADSVYGLQSGVIYETATPNPRTLHARLKLRMEEIVLAAESSTFFPTVLRIANCHGYSKRMRFDLLVNSLVRDAVVKKEIHISNENEMRTLIHVEDVCRTILSCLKSHPKLIKGEVFNVANSSQNFKLSQIANSIKSILPETKVIFKKDEEEITDYHLSCKKAENVFDFKPFWSLEDSMTQIKNLLERNVYKDPYSMQLNNSYILV